MTLDEPQCGIGMLNDELLREPMREHLTGACECPRWREGLEDSFRDGPIEPFAPSGLSNKEAERYGVAHNGPQVVDVLAFRGGGSGTS